MSVRGTFTRAAVALTAALSAIVLGAAPAAAQPPTEADLGVSVSARSTLLSPTITVTLTVTNEGPADSTIAGVYVRYLQDTGLSDSPGFPAGCQTYAEEGSRFVLCGADGLAAGQSRSFVVRVPVRLLTTNRNIEFVAFKLFSDPTDPSTANDRATDSCRALTALLVRC